MPMEEGAGDERAVWAAVEAGDLASAAARALRTHGPELFGFLVAVVDDLEVARVLYAAIVDRLPRALADASPASVRVLCYRLARGELARRRAHAAREPGARSPADVALPDPTTTISRRPTHVRAAVVALRGTLHEEERELLVLRVGRRFEWRELAQMSVHDGATEADVAWEERMLRRALQDVRGKLARAAEERHLLSPR